MMRQYQLQKSGSSYQPTLTEVSTPEPQAGEILVRVRATSLNYRDHMLGPLGGIGDKGIGTVPLSDGAGEVEAVGEGVTRFSLGDRVAGIFFQSWKSGRFAMDYHDSALGGAVNGMLSEYVVLHENGLVKIPDYLSYEEAATLPCAAVTVWQGLFARGGLQPGETVLALGTGGVSIFALQFAIAHGAKVIVTSSSDEKLEQARQLGAWQTINYKKTPDWDQEVWQLTEKRGVDHVIEVGGADTYERSLKTVAAGGQIVQIGILSGFEMRPNLFPLQTRNANISGIYVGSREHFEQLNQFLVEKAIHPIIDQVFPFEQVNAAYEHLAKGAHFGKVVITV
jgi:NADPH:quinone reductase-like Zn-dependent oxidoreductase